MIVDRPHDRGPSELVHLVRAHENWSRPSSYALRPANLVTTTLAAHRAARAERMETSTNGTWCMATTSARAELMETRGQE
ncbi:Uncharacterised protein [Cutibacterium granulosum]|uniref:Uncharacterized protein n=3 Tax=Cutibacterium granulosum TaxID=33011 RepID=A0A9X5LV68_9ACTN|nr:hypothetical protein H640_02852 [Cutibacterium granulosum TM11]SNV34061.1 Uncharacterised protein [Cutibacterium granulosum]